LVRSASILKTAEISMAAFFRTVFSDSILAD
jgi:hypothetical protein